MPQGVKKFLRRKCILKAFVRGINVYRSSLSFSSFFLTLRRERVAVPPVEMSLLNETGGEKRAADEGSDAFCGSPVPHPNPKAAKQTTASPSSLGANAESVVPCSRDFERQGKGASYADRLESVRRNLWSLSRTRVKGGMR